MPVTFTTPITLIRRSVVGTDELGVNIYSETPTVVHGIFAPSSGSSGTSSTSESTDARDQITSQPTVFLPDVDLTAIDRVEVLGLSYEVDGEPLNWPANPVSGWRPELPLEVSLRRVTG